MSEFGNLGHGDKCFGLIGMVGLAAAYLWPSYDVSSVTHWDMPGFGYNEPIN